MAQNHIDINTATSYGAVGMLKMVLSAPGVKVIRARINTTVKTPNLEADSKDWALIIECESENRDVREFEIRILMLTSGYGGSGPHDLLDCLKACGFSNIDENEIFTVGALKREYLMD